jgi:flagellar biosynthesis/type III secretory pathway ATPase
MYFKIGVHINMRYLLILSIFMAGCVCLNPAHKKSAPPIANTGAVIESLAKTQEDLVKAGESNTIVGDKVDKALTLAERLEKLLEQIEEESSSKLVKDPIK